MQCFQCVKKGHIKYECPGFKKGNQENKDASSKSTNLVEEWELEGGDGDMLSVSPGSDHMVDFWIMDSTY